MYNSFLQKRNNQAHSFQKKCTLGFAFNFYVFTLDVPRSDLCVAISDNLHAESGQEIPLCKTKHLSACTAALVFREDAEIR